VNFRPREIAKTAGMVVMKMCDDDVVDIFRAKSERLNRLDRLPENLASPAFRLVMVIAGIDHDHPLSGFQNPDEIIHRMRLVVRRIKDKALHSLAVVPVSIFDGIDFPKHVCHQMFPCWS